MAPRFAYPVLLVAGLALAGCTPTWPKCDKDDHCNRDGNVGVCVMGTCQECGRDADCKAGFACKNNKCSPKPECSASADCRAGYKCQGERCVPECAADTDCAKGMVCKSGRCAPTPECLSDADCPVGKSCNATQQCAEKIAEAKSCQLVPVRFDFNESTLTSSAQRQLDQNVECIKSRPAAITLAGHADERGTEEYNLHLGERRAAAVKKYLSTLGVGAAQLKTVSYGEERPSNPGHDEAAWSENRRVEFNEGPAGR